MRLGMRESSTAARRLAGGRAGAITLLLSLTIMTVVFAATAMLAMAAPPRLDWLRVQENRIVDEDGNTVTLRGVNVENWQWLWAYSQGISFERRAIDEVTAPPPEGWGGNVILLGVSAGPINRDDRAYLGFLDEMVGRAAANGAYTLLVYRAEEPNGPQPNMPGQNAERAMAKLASRYANQPAVLYGLQVEPHDVTWAQLKPRFTSMIDSIRAENPRALIAVPGTHWGRYIHHSLTDPIERDNLILKSHVYDPVAEIDSGFRFPEVAAKYPVIIGEFGAGTRMSMSDMDYLLNLSESLGMSWIAWLFNQAGCPCLLSSNATLTPSPYGAEVRRRMQAAATRNTHVLYDDVLHRADWSWNTTVVSSSDGPVYEGTRSLAVKYRGAWAGLSIYSGNVNTQPYTHLEFRLNANRANLPAIRAILYDTADNQIRSVQVQPGTPDSAGWHTVRIPLSDLGAAGTTVSRLALQEGAGGTPPTFYLDNIRLVNMGAEAPAPPTPTPTPTPVQQYAFYDDAFHRANWSWNTNAVSSNAGPVHHGAQSLAVTYRGGWAGMSIYSGNVETTPYTHLQFRLHANGANFPAIRAVLYDAAGDQIQSVRVQPSTPDSAGWHTVSIPLSDLHAAGTTVSRLAIQEGAGRAPATFYLDNIRLVHLNGSTPSPTPTPAPVQQYAFYDDAFHQANWSWNTDAVSSGNGPAYEGSKALAVTYRGGWAGMSIYSGRVDTTPYTHLEFKVRPSGSRFPTVSATLYDGSDNALRRVPAQPAGAPNSAGWYSVVIPLSDLRAARTTVSRVAIQETSGSAQPTFHLDQLRLVHLGS